MADLELDIVSTADSRGLTQAARDVDKLKGSSDALGKEFQDTARDSQDLDKRITSLRSSVRSLGAEFAKTQGPSVRQDLRSQRSLLAEFEKIRKELESQSQGIGVTLGSAIGTRAGSSAAGTFSRSFGEQLTSGGRIAMFARVIAVASPLLVPLGAMTAGVILGAVGAGGVIGGIALASRDARVKRGWKDLGRVLVADADVAAKAFVEPTILGIKIIREAWTSIQPEVRGIFADFAEGVAPLAEGIGGFLKEAIPGFRAVARAAEPFMEVLKEDLPELSEDISAFFQALERGAPGAAQGLHDFITLVGNAIQVTGFLFEGASKWWEKIRHEPWRLLPVAQIVTGVQILVDQIRDLNAMTDVGATTADAFATGLLAGAAASRTAEQAIHRQTLSIMDQRIQLRLLGDAYGEFIGLQLSVDQANLRVKQSQFDFQQSLRQTGYDFSDTTEAGLRNQQMAIDIVSAYDDQRQAAINLTGDTKSANEEFWRQVDALRNVGGKTRDAKRFLDDLAGDYKVRIMYDIIGEAVAGAAAIAASLFKKAFSFQHGGLTPAHQPFIVHRDEMLFSDRQHFVATKAQVQGMGNGHGGTQTVHHTVNFTGNTDAAFAAAFQRMVRNGDITISSKAIQN